MLLILSVLSMISCKRRRLICRRLIASSKAPSAPTPAASVGVASPARIEPSTAKISSKGGNSA